MMFLTMGVTFALRMSFPIVLTQMVYVPNLKPGTTNSTNNEIICPIKSHMIEHIDENDSVMPVLVISNLGRTQFFTVRSFI